MAPPLLALQNVALTFGGTPLITDADLSVVPGERACLVGRNGSGKSTLLKIAAGLMEADRGTRFIQPGATVRYLSQEPDLGSHPSTLAFVEAGLAPGDDPYRARYLLEQLGLTGEEHPERLSGGEARRAALAQVLAPQPDILLLDEPTNHLDLPAIEWLEAELRGLRSALVLISHDRRFLEGLSETTIWLDRGATRRMERGFADFEAWRDEVLAQEELERHKLDRKLAGGGRLAALRSHGPAQAQYAPPRQPSCHARGTPRPDPRRRDRLDDAERRGGLGHPRRGGGGRFQVLRRRAGRSRSLPARAPRRPSRHRRPERRRQDDDPQSPHRRARAR